MQVSGAYLTVRAGCMVALQVGVVERGGTSQAAECSEAPYRPSDSACNHAGLHKSIECYSASIWFGRPVRRHACVAGIL